MYQGGFFGAITVNEKLCMGDTSLSKYIAKNIKPIRNRNNISCGCKTCISAMLLQSDLNKWRLPKLAKINKLYINSESTRLLKISEIYFI